MVNEKLLEKISIIGVFVVAIVIAANQLQIMAIGGLMDGKGGAGFSLKSVSSKVNLLSGDGGVMVGPQLNPDGKTTKLVEWPTISEVPKPEDSGDPTQDAINYVIPTGVPAYVVEGAGSDLLGGISFDEPIVSQQVWAAFTGSNRFAKFGEKVELSPEQEQRWNTLTGVFTCDYCCGGPTRVTTINRCGCAHAYAWQGMARFFIKYYGDQYTDEEILGEMTRWKGLWYPKGMIQDYLVYSGNANANTLNHGGSAGIAAQFAGEGDGSSSASISEIENLPGMVGGC